nr:MAG TPA: hypothetical protein [Caudoviricetes sp.]
MQKHMKKHRKRKNGSREVRLYGRFWRYYQT